MRSIKEKPLPYIYQEPAYSSRSGETFITTLAAAVQHKSRYATLAINLIHNLCTAHVPWKLRAISTKKP